MNAILQEILELFWNFVEHGTCKNPKLFECRRSSSEVENMPELTDIKSDDEVSRPEFGDVVFQLIIAHIWMLTDEFSDHSGKFKFELINVASVFNFISSESLLPERMPCTLDTHG